jgi:hypothetical protein
MKVKAEKTTPGAVEVSVKENGTFLASQKARPY